MRAFVALFGLIAVVGLTGMQPPAPTKKADDKKPADDKAKGDPKKDDKKPAEDKKPADDKKPAAPAKVKSIVKVLVPSDKSDLTIMGQPTKSTGTAREFETPDLDPGKPYEYDFVLKFAPNNYTTITRTKTIKFAAGEAVTVDLTKKQDDDKAVIRWVPTPDDIVAEMLKLGKVTKDDVVYDLGCGDGKIVIAAVKDGKAKKGVGIDLDPEKVKEAKAKAKEAKVDDKVEVRQGDVLDIKDLPDATVVMMYMSDELGELIKPKLLAGLKVGTRVVSHRFKLGDWKPDESKTVQGEDGDQYTLHVWTVTADAKAGKYKKDEPKKDDKKDEKKTEPKKDEKKKD
jgi:uncharacterized protein (TIGR03000 family)